MTTFTCRSDDDDTPAFYGCESLGTVVFGTGFTGFPDYSNHFNNVSYGVNLYFRSMTPPALPTSFPLFSNNETVNIFYPSGADQALWESTTDWAGSASGVTVNFASYSALPLDARAYYSDGAGSTVMSVSAPSYSLGLGNPTPIYALQNGFIQGQISVGNGTETAQSALFLLILKKKPTGGANDSSIENIAMTYKEISAYSTETFRGGFNVPEDYWNYKIEIKIWDSPESMSSIYQTVLE